MRRGEVGRGGCGERGRGRWGGVGCDQVARGREVMLGGATSVEVWDGAAHSLHAPSTAREVTRAAVWLARISAPGYRAPETPAERWRSRPRGGQGPPCCGSPCWAPPPSGRSPFRRSWFPTGRRRGPCAVGPGRASGTPRCRAAARRSCASRAGALSRGGGSSAPWSR